MADSKQDYLDYLSYLKDVHGVKDPEAFLKQQHASEVGKLDAPMEEGVWYNPIDMLVGSGVGKAVTKGAGALSEGTASLAQKGAKATSKLGDWLTGKLASMTPMEQAIYKKSPQAVESMLRQAPEQTLEQLGSGIRKGVQGLMDKNVGLKEAVYQKLPQKTVAVSPEMFKGTAPELQQEFGRVVSAAYPDNVIKIPTGITNNLGEEIIKEEIRSAVPSGSIKIPAAQAQRLKEIGQQVSSYPSGQIIDPIEIAKRSASKSAATSLRKGIEGTAPAVAPINKEIGRLTRYSKFAQKMDKDPSRIAQQGLKARATANVLANEGGATGLKDLVDTYLATKSKSFQPEGIVSDLPKFAGRQAIKLQKGLEGGASSIADLIGKGSRYAPNLDVASPAIGGAIMSNIDLPQQTSRPEEDPEYQEYLQYLQSLKR